MIKFRQFLSESYKSHFEHVEDLLLLDGISGAKDSLKFLQSIRDSLSDKQSSVKLSLKIDGSPNLICGIDPESKKFFVATKAIFGKTPKINYTFDDIMQNHPDKPGLQTKLKYALKYLPKLGIKGVISGDVLFTKNDVKSKEIDKIQYLTFRPNTITYAVPTDSSYGKQISKAKFGIVFHTTFIGDSLSSLKPKFGVNLDSLHQTPDVWFIDSSFKNYGNRIPISEKDVQLLDKILAKATQVSNKLSSKFVGQLISDHNLGPVILAFTNSLVKNGVEIKSFDAWHEALETFIEGKFEGDIESLKTLQGKSKKKLTGDFIINIVNKDMKQLELIYEFQRLIVKAKGIILKKLASISQLDSFVETEDGFKLTDPEGLVAVDGDKVTKLVSRKGFSFYNFNLPKNWR